MTVGPDRIAAEMELTDDLLGQLERKHDEAHTRLEALGRLRDAMTPDEQAKLADRLRSRKLSVLADLRRLQAAAALTKSFLEHREGQLETWSPRAIKPRARARRKEYGAQSNGCWTR